MRDLDRTRTLAVLPIGAVEAHGPHLPLTTDVIIAEAMARAGGERLAARGYEVLLLPSLAYTAAEFAAGFPGTLSPSAAPVTALLVELAEGLGRHGIPVLLLANAHLDPTHRRSLQDASDRTRERVSCRIVFPDVARRQWAARLSEEFRSGACHAGRYETSVILAESPAAVRGDVLRTLPANARSLSAAIGEGKRSFEEADGPRAYFGDPAAASAEEGRETVAVLGEILEEAALAELSAHSRRAAHA